MICKHCEKEFNAKSKREKYCSIECRNNAKYIRLVIKRSNNLKLNFIENKDYVIDKWNGYAVKCMYGLYFKAMHPDKTLDDYKKEFPNALLCSEEHTKKTSKNSGKFMKEEKYRKMYSEMLKGENNPNHKSRTTEQHRKECSPFSKEFYKKHGGDRNVFIKKISENRTYNTRLDYYIKKGLSEDEAKNALSERQKTFTLEKCIARYGKEEGFRIFTERQDKWSKRCKCAKFEHNFINELIEYLSISESEIKYYKNKQLILSNNTYKKSYFYDFVYKNKIIEINGDFWHMNPKRFKQGDFNHMINKSAQETWEYDKLKLETAMSNGYDVFVVWESDIRKDKDFVMNRIKQYLNL